MKNKNANTNRGPGRPAYEPKVPQSKFTFADFMELNGVNFETGKGPNCSKLTLDKWLKRDKESKGKSMIVKLDETREPNSKNGLGRKTYVYVRRSKLDTLKSAKVATGKSKVSVNVGTAAPKARKAKNVSAATSEYEAQKAALLVPAWAVTITPVEPAPEPVAATMEATPENSPVLTQPETIAPVMTEVAPEPVTA
jgi:hypothetical protein